MEINPANEKLLGLTGQLYTDTKKQAKEAQRLQDVILDKSYDKYVVATLSAQPTESVDIEKIRQEMNAGQFDSPEAIGQAARNILAQGI